SKFTAAWATHGSSTATSTIAEPSCSPLRSAAADCGRTGSLPSSSRPTPRCERRKSMDFEDTPEEAEFRAGVRAFLDGNANRSARGNGMVYRAGNEDPAFRNRAKAWQAKKADAGYAGITWPKQWGGQGGTAIQQVIFDQEEGKYNVPRGLFYIGLGMCIP